MIERRTFRNGRRLPAAVFDSCALGLVLFAAIYIAVRPRFKNITIAVAAASLVFLAASSILAVIRRERFARHRKRLRVQAARDATRLKLLLDPGNLFERIPEPSSVYVFRNMDSITADDLRAAVKARGLPVSVVTEAKPTAAASELIKLSGGRIRIESIEEYTGLKLTELISITEEELSSALISRHSGCLAKPSLPKEIFRLTSDRAVKYLLVGAGLFALSFIMRYTLYYRVLAMLCTSLGAGFFGYEELKKRAPAQGRDPK